MLRNNFLYHYETEAIDKTSHLISDCHTCSTPAVVDTKTDIKSCPLPSASPRASTGVFGPASQSDGAITTHHGSERESGSGPSGPTVPARPPPPSRTQRWGRTLGSFAGRREDLFRGWTNTLSACGSPQGSFLQGSGFPPEVWKDEMAGGGGG